MTSFTVVISDDKEAFERNIEQMLYENWKLSGSLTVSPNFDGSGKFVGHLFCQALTRESQEIPLPYHKKIN